jgi:hypothetical protein
MDQVPEMQINKATPLNMLPNQSERDKNDETVQNVIKGMEELEKNNGELQHQEQASNQQYQQQQFAVNPAQIAQQQNAQRQQQQQQNQNPEYEYEEEYYQETPELTLKEKIVQTIKAPIIFIVVFLILSNDYIRTFILGFLGKWMKNVHMLSWADLGIRALLGAVLFYVVSKFL